MTGGSSPPTGAPSGYTPDPIEWSLRSTVGGRDSTQLMSIKGQNNSLLATLPTVPTATLASSVADFVDQPENNLVKT